MSPNATGGPHAANRAQPKLIHSHEETAVLAYLQSALNLACTEESIMRCQRLGDAHGLLDGVIVLRRKADESAKLEDLKLAVEYDGGRYHGADRVAADTEKSRRVLSMYPELTLIRIRHNAPPLPGLAHFGHRCVVVHVTDSHPAKVLAQAARELQHVVPRPWKQMMRNAAERPPQRNLLVEAVLLNVRTVMDKAYKDAKGKLSNLVGDTMANALLKVHGVLSRIDSVCEGIPVLRDDFGIKNLQTFMCDGVAAKFDDPETLYAVLRTLRTDFGIKNLQTFMCDGVAARLDDPPALYAVLRALMHAEADCEDEEALTTEEVVSIAKDASRFTLEFARTARSIKQLVKAKCVTFLSRPFVPHADSICALFRAFKETEPQNFKKRVREFGSGSYSDRKRRCKEYF
jgi:hypothetical protein